MKIIVKGEMCNHCYEYGCEHSKPHPKAKLDYFEVWQERTCSIREFNERFGKSEGLWDSKGTEHCEVDCDNSCCSGEHDKHCRRRMDDKKFWCVDFTFLSEIQEFIKDVGYCNVFIEDQDGCGLTFSRT